MFVIKVTSKLQDGKQFVRYIGRRGEKRMDISKVEGFKKLSNAEKYMNPSKKYDIFDIKCVDEYEIIEL